MNKRLVLKILGATLLIEAATMLPSYVIALFYQDPGDGEALLKTILLLVLLGLPMWLFAKPKESNLRAREGFVIVALAWLVLSAFGALPFVFSGFLPGYIDALFESVSGFTTTGATVATNFENYPHGVMLWRSFTHWIGGMGVLVLTLALLPQLTGRTSHLVRAESPGPSLSKIVPKMGDSAKILYLIYTVLTAVQFVILMLAGMNAYDAAIHAFATAGTGGFSNYASSIAAFNSPLIEWITTFFMVLFGINFALFYRAATGGWKEALRSEELHWYLGIYASAAIASALLLLPEYHGFWDALRYGSFQVASLMSTTGYATADFNLWPIAVKMILLMVMVVGGCAGSTAGGVKVVRTALLFKLGRREIRHTFQPRKVQVVRFEGKGVEENMLAQVAVFFCVYMLMLILGIFLISLEGQFDVETNLTAALTCISNVGPGLGAVGPTQNFSQYGVFAKIILCLLMLAGRLELFPILALFHPAIWRKS
jgi:trk system potassium uptake protein